jgi:hypothetical protein
VFWNYHTSQVFYKLICSPFSMHETMSKHWGMCEIMSEQPLMLWNLRESIKALRHVWDYEQPLIMALPKSGGPWKCLHLTIIELVILDRNTLPSLNSSMLD